MRGGKMKGSRVDAPRRHAFNKETRQTIMDILSRGLTLLLMRRSYRAEWGTQHGLLKSYKFRAAL